MSINLSYDLTTIVITFVITIVGNYVITQIIAPLFIPNVGNKIYLKRKKILGFLSNPKINTDLIIKCYKIDNHNSSSLYYNIKQILDKNYDEVYDGDLKFKFDLQRNNKTMSVEITLIPDDEPDENDTSDHMNIGQIQCKFNMNIKRKNFHNVFLNYASEINNINDKFRELNIEFKSNYSIICKLDNPPEIYRNTNLCSFDCINGNIKNDTRTITITHDSITIYSKNLDDTLADHIDKAIIQYAL